MNVLWKPADAEGFRDIDVCARLSCTTPPDLIVSADCWGKGIPTTQAGLCTDCYQVISTEVHKKK